MSFGVGIDVPQLILGMKCYLAVSGDVPSVHDTGLILSNYSEVKKLKGERSTYYIFQFFKSSG